MLPLNKIKASPPFLNLLCRAYIPYNAVRAGGRQLPGLKRNHVSPQLVVSCQFFSFLINWCILVLALISLWPNNSHYRIFNREPLVLRAYKEVKSVSNKRNAYFFSYFPLSATRKLSRYIIEINDHFSKWLPFVENYLFAGQLIQRLSIYGRPIRTHWGSTASCQRVHKQVKKLFEKWNIHQVPISENMKTKHRLLSERTIRLQFHRKSVVSF